MSEYHERISICSLRKNTYNIFSEVMQNKKKYIITKHGCEMMAIVPIECLYILEDCEQTDQVKSSDN